VIEKLKQINGIIVVDCPGNLNDNNLSILFEAADFIIVPMAYDVDTIDATNIFVDVVKKRSQAKLLFLPNRINVSEGRAKDLEMRDDTIKQLNKVGKVMPRIKQSVIIKRYTTIYPLDMYQYMALEEPFEAIIKEIKKKK
jgi:chromosome partitioning protein